MQLALDPCQREQEASATCTSCSLSLYDCSDELWQVLPLDTQLCQRCRTLFFGEDRAKMLSNRRNNIARNRLGSFAAMSRHDHVLRTGNHVTVLIRNYVPCFMAECSASARSIRRDPSFCQHTSHTYVRGVVQTKC